MKRQSQMNRLLISIGVSLTTLLSGSLAASWAIEPVALDPQLLAISASPMPGLGNADTYLPSVDLPLRLKISLSRRQVTLYEGDTALKSYPVAVGKAGWETPRGKHAVILMLRNPAWLSPFNGSLIRGGSPNNPLGRHWIGFWTDGKNTIGFHGTPNPKSVGQAVSHGCVRMHNRDIEDLFQKVKVGTVVEVVP
jgi:lipoprotein-anchoring transpeptidase ErfK/SrfK